MMRVSCQEFEGGLIDDQGTDIVFDVRHDPALLYNVEADPQELYRLTPATFSNYDEVIIIIVIIVIIVISIMADYECDGGATGLIGGRRHLLGRLCDKGERSRGNALLQVSVRILIKIMSMEKFCNVGCGDISD